ncbi:MAG: thiamine phosphate synthase, partial [Planctomycetota bacterium]
MERAALRILDANRNRALEGLRVAEEHARFVLEAADPAAEAKALRQALDEALAPWADEALRARDVGADPGHPARRIDRRARADTGEVARAALGRVKEAFRALEEYGKLLDPALATRLSGLRYRTYALEQALFSVPEPFGERRVYVLLGSAPGRPPVLEQAEACLAGGVRLFQLREKGLGDRARLALARELVARCAREGAWVLVNDRPDLARLAGAAGVHLGQEDLDPRDARCLLGPRARIGASVHDAGELERALAAGADHVGFGTLFPSGTKPELRAQGLGRLAALAPACPLPVFGIGGVDAATAGAVLA